MIIDVCLALNIYIYYTKVLAVNMKFEDATNTELTSILQEYVDTRYWSIIDFTHVIENAEVENDKVWFDLGVCTIGLHKDTLEYADVIGINNSL
jgi:hypothetical protein